MSGLSSYSSSQIVLSNYNGFVRFEYDPTKQTLIMVTTNGQMVPLLDHCASLRFDIRQRNQMTNSWDEFPIAVDTPNLCKVVQVTWTCSRTLFGSVLFNTEIMQTTRIVLREH
jgi:hypothetical protein